MRILVTGDAGCIGSHVVDQSIAAGHSVSVIDRLWKEERYSFSWEESA